MYRNIINDFANWYDQTKRKILYVKGAKGVGKTWAVRDFATAFSSSNAISIWQKILPVRMPSPAIPIWICCCLNVSVWRRIRLYFIFDEVQAVPDCAEFSMLSARIIQITPSV